MWSFAQAKNKLYDVYSICKDKASNTALAIVNKIPAQARDMVSRPFSSEASQFLRESPETQRVLKVTITANVLYASVGMIYQFNNYLLSGVVPDDEYNIERNLRYLAYTTNSLLWLFVIRKSIRMLVENGLNGACVYKAIVLDHPEGHHQADCRKKHPELKIILEDIAWYNIPKLIKTQIEEYQKIINEVRYTISVISGSIASNAYYVIDMQLVKILSAYLPYGALVEILLRAMVTGHSLPEYNFGNQCTRHKHEEMRKENVASFVIGIMHTLIVEMIYALTGNAYVKDAAANVLYQLLIPIMMMKPIKVDEDGHDYFYYNRSLAKTIMEITSNKMLSVLKESGYTLQLMYERPILKKLEDNIIYLHLRRDEAIADSTWPTITRRKSKREMEAKKENNEWIEFVAKQDGKVQNIKLSEEKLGKHLEKIKLTLKSNGRISELPESEKRALYGIAAEYGFPTSLGVRCNETAKSYYANYIKNTFISEDMQSLDLFVRRPDVKRYLDYNAAIFKKVEEIIIVIKDSYLAKAGNMLPDWWVTENLQNVKKVLEAVFLEKSEVVLQGLQDLLNAHKTHLNEHEASTIYTKILEPKRLAESLLTYDTDAIKLAIKAEEEKIEKSKSEEVKADTLSKVEVVIEPVELVLPAQIEVVVEPVTLDKEIIIEKEKITSESVSVVVEQNKQQENSRYEEIIEPIFANARVEKNQENGKAKIAASAKPKLNLLDAIREDFIVSVPVIPFEAPDEEELFSKLDEPKVKILDSSFFKEGGILALFKPQDGVVVNAQDNSTFIHAQTASQQQVKRLQ